MKKWGFLRDATNTIWDSWETNALRKLKIHDGHFKNLTFSGIEWDEPKVLHIPYTNTYNQILARSMLNEPQPGTAKVLQGRLVIVPESQFLRWWAAHQCYSGNVWVLPKIEVPQNGWFIMENPIKMDYLGVPLFLETPKCILRFVT